MAPSSDHVSLREFIERVLDERQKALDVRFISQQEALGLASRTLELRLEKLNELRQEVTTDRGNYITREKYDADQKSLHQKMDDNFRSINQWQDRADGSINVVRFLGASGVVALIIELARASGVLK